MVAGPVPNNLSPAMPLRGLSVPSPYPANALPTIGVRHLSGGSVLLAPQVGFPPTPCHRLQAVLRKLPPLSPALLLFADSRQGALRNWARICRSSLSLQECQSLLLYTAACEQWAYSLAQLHLRAEAAGDYRARPAEDRSWTDHECRFAMQFEARHIKLEPQLVVSQHAQACHGAYWDSYWLDGAYRDGLHELLVDVELDGLHHQDIAQRCHDQRRNDCLRRRGWYVLRVPTIAAWKDCAIENIVARTAEQMDWHRWDITLATAGAREIAGALMEADRTVAPTLGLSEPEEHAVTMTARRSVAVVAEGALESPRVTVVAP